MENKRFVVVEAGIGSYGYLVSNKEDKKVFILRNAYECDEYNCIGGKGEEVRPETVGMFMDLDDKNKKAIYEGDLIVDTGHGGEKEPVIVRFGKVTKNVESAYTGHGIKTVGIVCFYFEGSQGEQVFPQIECLNDLEVAGNIYDNPELLEGK